MPFVCVSMCADVSVCVRESKSLHLHVIITTKLYMCIFLISVVSAHTQVPLSACLCMHNASVSLCVRVCLPLYQ